MENKLKDKTMERWNKLKDNIPSDSDIFCRDLQKKINEPAAIYFREENWICAEMFADISISKGEIVRRFIDTFLLEWDNRFSRYKTAMGLEMKQNLRSWKSSSVTKNRSNKFSVSKFLQANPIILSSWLATEQVKNSE